MAANDCLNLPDLSLDLKDGPDDIYRLLQEIRPDWDKKKVQFKPLSGGNACHMYRCSYESDEPITVRVKKIYTDGVVPVEDERNVIKMLSSKGYFPPLIAMFKNGFCYEYIKGRPAVMPDTEYMDIDEDQLRLIADMTANFHSLTIPEFDHTRTSYFDYFRRFIEGCEVVIEGCPSLEELKDEITFIEEVVSKVESPLVLIHGDLHPANMVWNKQEQKITVADWETAKVAPRGCDIAYFLNSFDYLNKVLSIPATKPPDTDRTFCEHYLKRWNRLHNKSPPTEEEMEQLLLEKKYYTLIVKLVWLLIVVKFGIIMRRYGNLDSMWKINYEQYIEAKDKVLGIKKFGRS